MNTTIALIGTMDTKGEEYGYLKRRIIELGYSVFVIDAGVLGDPALEPDITRFEVAKAGGSSIESLITRRDRGQAMEVMGRGIAELLSKLYSKKKFDAVIALGGGGGTSIATAGMRALPIGVPKVMVSTLAGGDVSGFTGSKDIVMIPSIVDISGINRITREVLTRAAGAVCGMASGTVAEEKEKPAVACTMFGNTTIAVNHAKKFIEGAGYEVVVFPCTGASGRAMEDLINSGHISGVLDITLTEWADELAGGVLSAGPKRLDAASKTGIPQVVVPGCLDMVNFWAPETIPEKYRGRKFYRHNPNVTLMRTNIEENKALGEIISEKLNKSRGKVCVFLPLRGLSMIDAPGGHFWWPEADQALFDALKKHLHKGIDIISLDYNINDEEFACECAKKFLDLMNERNISGYNA